MSTAPVTWGEPSASGSWRDQAACRGADPEIFHPASDEAADLAKRVCAGCAVREPCLEFAVMTREKDGVWGGMTARERRRLIRRRQRSA